MMVLTGWKKSGAFKVTPKHGMHASDAAVSARLPDTGISDSGSRNGDNWKGDDLEKGKEPFQLHHVHDSLSKVCFRFRFHFSSFLV